MYLKKCPFCGGEAELKYDRVGVGGIGTASFIRCRKCEAQTFKYVISPKYASDDMAIEAWNRRIGEDNGESES